MSLLIALPVERRLTVRCSFAWFALGNYYITFIILTQSLYVSHSSVR